MTSPTPSAVSVSVARVRHWLASTKVPRGEIAARASVDEKTLRLAARATWNPTANTLARLEALIPPDWTADCSGGEPPR